MCLSSSCSRCYSKWSRKSLSASVGCVVFALEFMHYIRTIHHKPLLSHAVGGRAAVVQARSPGLASATCTLCISSTRWLTTTVWAAPLWPSFVRRTGYSSCSLIQSPLNLVAASSAAPKHTITDGSRTAERYPCCALSSQLHAHDGVNFIGHLTMLLKGNVNQRFLQGTPSTA